MPKSKSSNIKPEGAKTLTPNKEIANEEIINKNKKEEKNKKEKITIKFKDLKNIEIATIKGNTVVDKDGIAKDVPMDVVNEVKKVRLKFEIIEKD